MDNVELFELCETIPKVQSSECLLYWNQGTVYCTCGHPLRESESSRHLHQWRLDALSSPNCVIKKVRSRGARHGKTEAQKEHFIALDARRRSTNKNFEGIHDRFKKDLMYSDSQLRIGWTEEKCIEMDKLAQKDFTYCPSTEEFERKKEKLVFLAEHIWQKCTDETPIRLPRSINNALHRLHRESGEERLAPIPLYQYQKWHSSSSSSSAYGGSGMTTGEAQKFIKVDCL